jgi:hypothetical protein
VYVVGGNDGEGHYLATVEAYDPGSNTWETRASLPIGKQSPCAAVLGGNLYVAGGFDGSGPLNSMHIYYAGSNLWAERAAPPYEVRYGAAMNGKLVAMGLEAEQNRLTIYDPGNDSWGAPFAPPIVQRHDLALAADEAGHKLYLMGGWNGFYVSDAELLDSCLP